MAPLVVVLPTAPAGAVEGPRIERVMQDRAAASGRTQEEEADRALRNQSVHRFVDPEDIGALAVFLAGPRGRSLSGQLLPVDGDSQTTQ